MDDNFKHSQILLLPEHMEQHNHNYNQIVITLSGQTQFDIDGCGNIVCAGQGCVVSADSEHTFSGIGSNKILVLNIPPGDAAALEGIGNEQSSAVFQRSEKLFSQSSYFRLDSQAQNLAHLLGSEISAHPDDRLLSKACSDTLICVLQRHFGSQGEKGGRNRLNMDALDQYIAAHCAHKISVMQLAGLVFLGESQFYLLFKEQTGMTPHQYVLKKRLERAKELISQSQFSLAHIALSCGFSSQSSFTQAFSNVYKIPPSRYRRSNLYP
ncbi:helix-turn-helix domain-containing protein [Psychromonas sp.]|uniref:helix-turn-helix domain-containing protein n=1 Tax=Psychromonas sp. TaxID=1884585 RepID=UPI003561CF31